MCCVTEAGAGWSPDGSPLLETTAWISNIVACSDGSGGAVVAWREGYTLRALHMLPTGVVDSSWPSGGVLMSDTVATREAIGIVPDDLGGAYVWWIEYDRLFVTRVTGSGVIAPGWPTRGRLLGFRLVDIPYPYDARPCVIADGQHGIYFAWAGDAPGTLTYSLWGYHIGVDNTPAGGWPEAPLDLGLPGVLESYARLALTPDGGVFVAYMARSFGECSFKLSRRTGSGELAPGWPAEGLGVAAFPRANLPEIPDGALVDVAPDGRGGALVVVGVAQSYSEVWYRLFRFTGDCATAAGWPAEGRELEYPHSEYWFNMVTAYTPDADGSIRVLPDGFDGAIVGIPNVYSHSTSQTYCGFTDSGALVSWTSATQELQHEAIPNGRGGMYVATCVSANSPYFVAHLALRQSSAAPGWEGYHVSAPGEIWPFGDVALAPTGDGGAFLIWSEYRERQGMFARRFAASGEVVDVERSSDRLGLHRAWFLSGSGVQVRGVAPPGSHVQVELFDVGGRRIVAARVPGEGHFEVVVPGTRSLQSGVYFLRAAAGLLVTTARVAVAR
jgi:hypothetical protein